MKQVKDAFVEVLVIFFVGGLVGSIMSVVSNLFVIAVKWLSQQRMNSDILNINFGGFDLSMSSLVFLWDVSICLVSLPRFWLFFSLF